MIIFKSVGGLAQLARAPALQAGGQRFDSVILHHSKASERVPFYFCIQNHQLSNSHY